MYKQDIDKLQTRNSTLSTLIEAILNYPQEDVPDLVRQIRTCESLDQVAETINAYDNDDEADESIEDDPDEAASPFERKLSVQLGQLKLDNEGTTHYYGGTSNLVFMPEESAATSSDAQTEDYIAQVHSDRNPVTSWTTVTTDPELVIHLLNMYFCWHYTFFVTLSRQAFNRHFRLGKPPLGTRRKIDYCTPLLVNAMLALGCHFSSRPEARANPSDAATAGDHFFREAKRILMEGEEYEHPRLPTVQALALMSVREAGCGREAKGWAYSVRCPFSIIYRCWLTV